MIKIHKMSINLLIFSTKFVSLIPNFSKFEEIYYVDSENLMLKKFKSS